MASTYPNGLVTLVDSQDQFFKGTKIDDCIIGALSNIHIGILNGTPGTNPPVVTIRSNAIALGTNVTLSNVNAIAIPGNARIDGFSRTSVLSNTSHASIGGNLAVIGAQSNSANTSIGGDFAVIGAQSNTTHTSIGGNLVVLGDFALSGPLQFTGSLSNLAALSVTGGISVGTDGLYVSGEQSNASGLDVTSNMQVGMDLVVIGSQSNKFDLDVTSNLQVGSNLVVVGHMDVSSSIKVSNDGGGIWWAYYDPGNDTSNAILSATSLIAADAAPPCLCNIGAVVSKGVGVVVESTDGSPITRGITSASSNRDAIYRGSNVIIANTTNVTVDIDAYYGYTQGTIANGNPVSRQVFVSHNDTSNLPRRVSGYAVTSGNPNAVTIELYCELSTTHDTWIDWMFIASFD